LTAVIDRTVARLVGFARNHLSTPVGLRVPGGDDAITTTGDTMTPVAAALPDAAAADESIERRAAAHT